MISLRENYKTQLDKFIKAGIDKNIVVDYLEKFKTIATAKYTVARDADLKNVNVPKGNSRFDVDKYKTFQELETFVDYVFGQVDASKQKGSNIEDIEIDAKPLIEKNGLKIYYAKDKHACIKYKGGGPYSWCVSRDASSNMYNRYRYGYTQPAFYFVKDIEATEKEFSKPFSGTFENPWHFIVIQVTRDGEYIVTNSNNDDDASMTWNEIVKHQPKLAGMEEYFKSVPLTDREVNLYNKFRDHVPDDEFKKLNYQDKSFYLDVSVPNSALTDSKFFDLPDDLKNKYISFGLELTDDQYAYVKSKPALLKRFIELSIRKFEEKATVDRYVEIEEHQLDCIINSVEGQKAIRELSKQHDVVSIILEYGNFKKILELFGKDFIFKKMNLHVNFQKTPEKLFFYNDESEWPIIEEFLGKDYMTNTVTVDRAMSRNIGSESHTFSFLKLLVEKYKKKVSSYDVTLALYEDSIDYIIDLYSKNLIVFDSRSPMSDLGNFITNVVTTPTFDKHVWKFINALGTNTISTISGSNYVSFLRLYHAARKLDAAKADALFLESAKIRIIRNPWMFFDLCTYMNLSYIEGIQLLGGPSEFKDKIHLDSDSVVRLLSHFDNIVIRTLGDFSDDKVEYVLSAIDLDKFNTVSFDSNGHEFSTYVQDVAQFNPVFLFKNFGEKIVNTINDYKFFSIVKYLSKRVREKSKASEFINLYMDVRKMYIKEKISDYHMILAIFVYGSVNKLSSYFQQMNPEVLERFEAHVLLEILERCPHTDDYFNYFMNMIGSALKKSILKQSYLVEVKEYLASVTKKGPSQAFRFVKYIASENLNPSVIAMLLEMPFPIQDKTKYIKTIIDIIGVERVKQALTAEDGAFMVKFLSSWMVNDIYVPVLIDLFGYDYIKKFVLDKGISNTVVTNTFLKERHQEYKQHFK